jgi:HAD superfamily hydrolase (TIGR01549 family)
MPRAVLFDLDDTLFDHRRCAHEALSGIHRAHPALRALPFAELERVHAALLDDLHARVLSGDLGLEAAREERFRRLFQAAGVRAADEIVAATAATYREGYIRIRQAIPGAAALLGAVRGRAAIGIVSNNLLAEQQGKLRDCGLDAFIDVLVVSEEAGCSKPDPRIFQIALERLQCEASDVVMIGDSWAADVIGASDAGIRAIWFNPQGRPSPDPSAGIDELHRLDPPDEALALIFQERRAGRSRAAS